MAIKTKTKFFLIIFGFLCLIGLNYYFFGSKDRAKSEESISFNLTDKLNEQQNFKDSSSSSDEFVNNAAVETQENPAPVIFDPHNSSPISGLNCPENKDRRPIAVMLAADKRVRPLSGVSQADLVIEMPVITSMVTRLMAVYVCNSPDEIGSIRSARHDYITLAKGLDAILAHWGGSHFALDYLKNEQTLDNLDALSNPYNAFYRKQGISRPDNGFTSYQRLYEAASKMGYRMENQFLGYPHRNESPLEKRGGKGVLTVGFSGWFRVEYTYDPVTNTYLRKWGEREDVDKTSNERIAPKNIVVMFAESRQIEGQYNDVEIEGQGEMHAYMEGRVFKGIWRKEKGDCVIGDQYVCLNDKPLLFFKQDGQELEFIPGQIWIEILQPGQVLRWKNIE
ncbi:MAG: DUF3048 domain-containing protein [Candidatus Moranbacteria bacterium]|nr:DUF3048 domain-containing protein [Candidatus Moranbacteria bacterium]